MKLSRSSLFLLALLASMYPATTVSAVTITSQNGHIQMNLLGNGDSFAGGAITTNWSAPQIAAVQEAIDTWEGMFRNVPSRTVVGTMLWEVLEETTLGSSLSNMASYTGNGYNYASTTEIVWREGATNELNQLTTDFSLRFNTNFAFSTDNVTPGDKFDLVSVLFHEIGHNMGFNTTNNRAIYQGEIYTVWDSLIKDSNGNSPGNPNFNYWEGDTYTIGSGGLEVYNPAPFEPGSSMAHIKPTTDPNALMKPSIGAGVQVRDLSDKEKALLTEMGWVFTNDPTYYASVDGQTITNNLDNFFTSVLVNRDVTVDAETDSSSISLKNLTGRDGVLTLTVTQGKQTTVIFENNAASVCDAIIDGNDANFEKTGDQNLSLNGNITTTGKLKVSTGGIALAGSSNSLGELELAGGVLAIAKLGTHEVTATTGKLTAQSGMLSLINGSSLVLDQAGDHTIASQVNLSGQGIISLDATATLSFQGSNTVDESITISGTNGATLAISSGTLSIKDSAFINVTNLSFGSPSATFDLGSSTNTIVKTLVGAGVIASSPNGQITLNSADDASWAGTFAGQGIFNKRGVGKLSLTGTGGNQFALSVHQGSLELNNANAQYFAINMAGGTLLVSQKATLSWLNGTSGTLTLDSSTLSLTGVNNTIGSALALNGTGALDLTTSSLLTIQSDYTINSAIAISGQGTLSQQNGKLTLANNAKLQNVALLIGSNAPNTAASTASVDLGSTQQSVVSKLSGNGNLNANAGMLTIRSNEESAFSGQFIGSGTITKEGAASWIYSGSGSKTFNIAVKEGSLSLSRNTAEAIIFHDFTLESKSSLNISMVDTSAKNNTTLSISGKGEFKKNSTISMHVNPMLTQYKSPIIFTEGNGSLSIDGSTFIISSYVAGSEQNISWKVLSGNVTGKDLKITAGGALAAGYTNILLQDNGNGEIVLTGKRKAENPFLTTATSSNSAAGSELLWNASLTDSNSHLGLLNGAVSEMWNTKNYTEANRILSASAGSTIPSLIVAQHASSKREMTFIRNRIPGMRAELGLADSEYSQTSWWMEGTANHDKLDSQADLAGYSLSSWGGRTGFDVNINERWTAGAAFSASYGKYSANSTDRADGNIDSYFINAFTHLQNKKWGHSLIVTGGIFDSSFDRYVSHALDSYRTTGSTNGSSIGAMYELSYDIAINESQTTLFQPIFNVSITHSSVKGFDESGADSTNLRVDNMSMTTGTLALGGRLSGILDYSLKGRPIIGELRLMISQDVGAVAGKAQVAYLSNPSFAQTVRSADMSRTAVQIGAGINIPCSDYGAIYLDALSELRADNNTIGGSIGYRYNF